MPWITEAKMSRRGGAPGIDAYSSLISFGDGAGHDDSDRVVGRSTSTAATRFKNAQLGALLEPTRRWMKSMSHWMPPYSFTRAPMQATMMEITVMSYMEVTTGAHYGEDLCPGKSAGGHAHDQAGEWCR